jgi:hypothetical protein
VRDGYGIFRTLLGMLSLYNPSITFILPGVALFLVSALIVTVLTATRVSIGSFIFETNTLLGAGMLSLAGFQFATFGITLHLYGVLHKYTKPDRIGMACLRAYGSPWILAIGTLALFLGLAISVGNLLTWASRDFGAFTDTPLLFSGTYLSVWGLQLLLSSLFLSPLLDDLRTAELVSSSPALLPSDGQSIP